MHESLPISPVPDGAAARDGAGMRGELTHFERLISGLSARFINLPANEVDAALQDSLRDIVLFMAIDRASISRFASDSSLYRTHHSWAVPGVVPVSTANSTRNFPWVYAQAKAGKAIVFSRLADLPPEAAVDRDSYQQFGLRSHIGQPIVVAGRLYGILGFGCVRHAWEWSSDDIERTRLLADIVAHAIARVHAQEEVDRAVGFERLASSILAALLVTPAGAESEAVRQGLRRIGAFLHAERVTLWERAPGRRKIFRCHEWSAEAAPVAVAPPGADDYPWLGGQMSDGCVVRFSELMELPLEARDDLPALRAAGTRSKLAVPISVRGAVVGAFSIASMDALRDWPDGVVSGVKLLAEVFATLHERQSMERRKQAAEVEAALWRERLAHLVRVHTAGEMSVALAHEITQPLGAIENYALAARRRAGERTPDLAHIVELLDKVVGQATRAGDVVSRMRSMVQRHELQPREIDVGHAVRECIEMLKVDFDVRQIRVETRSSDRKPIVVVDEIHLQQVVLNLLRNAMQAMEGVQSNVAKSISIEIAFAGPREVWVQVADRGVGIAEGDLERVFESFYSTKADGLGVGLAICRRLIEAHGGVLQAAHNPGGGAIFRFALPAAPRAD